MRIGASDFGAEWVVVLFNNKKVAMPITASEEEGWVDAILPHQVPIEGNNKVEDGDPEANDREINIQRLKGTVKIGFLPNTPANVLEHYRLKNA